MRDPAFHERVQSTHRHVCEGCSTVLEEWCEDPDCEVEYDFEDRRVCDVIVREEDCPHCGPTLGD